MSDIDWKATALKAGWREGKEEPHGEVLIHDDQDRIWPKEDFKGALEDLGFDADDPDWQDDIVYVEPALGFGR